jgi:hypothetical protein
MKSPLQFIFSILLLPISLLAQSKNNAPAKVLMDSVNFYYQKVFSKSPRIERIAANKQFSTHLEAMLLEVDPFKSNFDSLKYVTQLTSDDNQLKLFNWNIPNDNEDGQFYCCLLVHRTKKKETYEITKLIDISKTITNIENFIGSKDKWPGMLYFKIITHKMPAEVYYTLLGWEGHNAITKRKLIEVLSFKSNGDPIFGKAIFEDIPNKSPKRISFEYAAQLTMNIKHYKDKKMLVFDHLAPREAELEGQFQFYGPDMSYDAFKLKEGKWYFTADVSMKNEPNERSDGTENKKYNKKKLYNPK